MRLDEVTPVILTYNEAPNIERTLRSLEWARDVVVVDSFSTDGTVEIAKAFDRVRVTQRPFDTHAAQWNFAIHETGISVEWVLALDADYILTRELVTELEILRPELDVAGYRARFTYCVFGRPLRRSLYPPVTILFRRECARYDQDGHTQRVRLTGKTNYLRNIVYHDDRKPLSRWLVSQSAYMSLECAKLLERQKKDLTFADKIRKWRLLSPALTFLYCMIGKGALLDGWPGVFYSIQRSLAELILSMHLLEKDLQAPNAVPACRRRPE